MSDDTRSEENALAAMRALIGKPIGATSVAPDPVNQPMIRHWAAALEDHNPVQTDPAFPSSSRFQGIIAPPLIGPNRGSWQRQVADDPLSGRDSCAQPGRPRQSRGGEAVPRTYRVYLPEEIDARAIRLRKGLSQAEFARTLGVSRRTLQDWEQGRRIPDATARAFLRVIDREPAAVKRALAG